MIDKIITRLDRVRQTGPDKWQACCPAHEDKTPSLNILDAGDRVLVKCWAGCSFDEIAQAMDIKPHEFFRDSKAPKQTVKGFSQKKSYDLIDTEIRILLIFYRALIGGKLINDSDHARARQAKKRLVSVWRNEC